MPGRTLHGLMREYAAAHPRTALPGVRSSPISACDPLPPEQPDAWVESVQPSRLSRTYRLDDPHKALPLIELLLMCRDAGQHSARLAIESTIEGASVGVEVWTPGLDAVSARDREFAAQCDLARRDLDAGWQDYVRSQEGPVDPWSPFDP